MKSNKIAFVLIGGAVALISSCSLKQLAIDTVIDALSSGGGTTITGDDDPQLIAEALPFTLKLYEILLAQSPGNEGLLLTTGSGFVMYANAFIQAPSDRLPDDEYERRNAMRVRAKRMYLRGRDYVLDALELRHTGFREAALTGDISVFLEQTDEEDVPFLYWCSAGWFGAISIDSFDMKLGMTRENAIALMNRALEIDETWSDGSIHEFFISYYGSLPVMLGGSEEKARYHFERTIEISGGKRAGAYVSLATAVSIKNQDVDEFRDLLDKALAIETDDPENRLVTIITQEKARWLLDNIDNFFLVL